MSSYHRWVTPKDKPIRSPERREVIETVRLGLQLVKDGLFRGNFEAMNPAPSLGKKGIE